MERLTRRDKVGGNEFVRINKGAPDFIVYEKLADYEDLEEQGKLLKLPCAVGDTVYAIHSISESKHLIYDFKMDELHLALNAIKGTFGKTVFLTEEEAEAALKEMSKE